MLSCLAATTQISQQRGMQPRELSGCRFVSSNRPARHLYQQPNSTIQFQITTFWVGLLYFFVGLLTLQS
jgi:hypothetical protein